MANNKRFYEKLLREVREINLLGSVSSLLSWDQETYLPKDSVEIRAQQLELISRMSHTKQTDEKLWEKIEGAKEENLSENESANLREIRRDVQRARKLPAKLVSELSNATSFSQEAWKEARKQNSFDHFKPHLKIILNLKKEMARCLATSHQSEYDALLDIFEPEMTQNILNPLFENLKKKLIPLIQTILEKQNGGLKKLEGPFPIAEQKQLNQKLLEVIGFDLRQGRLDETTHPFCGGTPGDVRLTTRYNESSLCDSFYSTAHEAGHGLYEQGFAPENQFTPLGESCSMGFHESQSRFWENIIGRSKPFFEFFLPTFKKHFPESFSDRAPADLFKIFNQVEPSFIRTASDEVTYNLHIILRYEIEEMLFNNTVQVDDLPEIWNQKMKNYLGITPPNNTSGVLQDIHWSLGLFAYFPAYTLGNLYAAQWWHYIRQEIPDVENQIRHGNFNVILNWLREKIHRQGRFYSPETLCFHITGEKLNEQFFLDYLKTKFEI